MQKIILSPHIDDAILSLGGSILKWIDDGEQVRIINVFSKSITYRKFRKISGGVERETELRKQEEQDVIDEVGNIFEYLDLPSNGCRAFGRFRKFLSVQTQANLFCDRLVMKELIKILENLFASLEADVYIPISPYKVSHIDHILVREAALKAAKNSLNQVVLWLYEDMPYCARDSSYIHVLENNTTFPIVMSVDFKDRLRLALKYRSQVKNSWIEEMRSYHRVVQGERAWMLTKKFNAAQLGHAL